MKEMDIQLFWLNNAIQLEQLFTSSGSALKIIHPGMINLHQGPDFLHATIQIDDTIWVGSVEIHIKTSGWFHHRHDLDLNYQNVILHVVWEDDTHSFDHCPMLVLCKFLKGGLTINGLNAQKAQHINQITYKLPLDTLLEFGLQRMERKANEILVDLKLFQGDWQFISLRKLIYAFGIPLNGDVFQQIIDMIYPIFNTYYFNEEDIRCLIFGFSGMFMKMNKVDVVRFNYLRSRFLKMSTQFHFIKFRTRPSNFPEKRMEQFVAFIFKFPTVFRSLIESKIDFSDLIKAMRIALGEEQFNKIVINVFVPVLIAYSKYNGNMSERKKALHWMTLVPAESNLMTRRFVLESDASLHALHTQGMLEYYYTSKNITPN